MSYKSRLLQEMTNGVDPRVSLRVQCYSGYRAEETPRRFFIGERAVEVSAVLDRWLAPEHAYFKVIGGDDGIYILRHDVSEERWELIFYDGSETARETMPPSRTC